MARSPKPWRRETHGGAWYATIRGRQVRIADPSASPEDAFEAFCRIRLAKPEPAPPSGRVPLQWVLGEFWARSESECKASTAAFYRRRLKRVVAAFPGLAAEDLKPADVTRWVRGSGWADSTKRGTVLALKTAFRWAVKAKLIPADPLADLPLPPAGPRQTIPSGDDVRRLLDATAGTPLGDFLAFVWETGCRLGEASALDASQVDLAAGVCVLAEHKTRGKTGRPRVIVLTPRAVEIVARQLRRSGGDPAEIRRRSGGDPAEIRKGNRHKPLCDKGKPCGDPAEIRRRSAGHVFLNSKGRPWLKDSVGHGVRRWRKRLGLGREVITHGLRHRFATDALKTSPNGVVAALLGHTSTAMVDRVYSKLAGEVETLREAVERARPG